MHTRRPELAGGGSCRDGVSCPLLPQCFHRLETRVRHLWRILSSPGRHQLHERSRETRRPLALSDQRRWRSLPLAYERRDSEDPEDLQRRKRHRGHLRRKHPTLQVLLHHVANVRVATVFIGIVVDFHYAASLDH